MKRLSILICAIIVSHMSAFSLTKESQSTASASQVTNSGDEVRLVVSGDGQTEEQAINTALRSAIEQAYGTFVSANTSILNDSLVKDEIVTISTGNIKSYEKVASAQLPDGKTTVTLDAVVCVSKLTNYAKSKGASTEFAGASFGMNMKIKELNRQNELKALYNLLEQIKLMLPTAFDMKLYVDDPALPEGGGRGFLDCVHPVLQCTKHFDHWSALLYYDKTEYTNLVNKIKAVPNYNYSVTFNVLFEPNANTKSFYTFIVNSLLSLGLSKDEVDEYKKSNIPVIDVEFSFNRDLDLLERYDLRFAPSMTYHSRISKQDLEAWMYKSQVIFSDYFSNFQIVDNLGTKSFFNSKAIYEYKYIYSWGESQEYNNPFIKIQEKKSENLFSVIKVREDKELGGYLSGDYDPEIIDNSPLVVDNGKYAKLDSYRYGQCIEKAISKGEGLFSPLIMIDHAHRAGNANFGKYKNEYNLGDVRIDSRFNSRFKNKPAYCYWTIRCLIPQDKISQYNNFRVEPKH